MTPEVSVATSQKAANDSPPPKVSLADLVEAYDATADVAREDV